MAENEICAPSGKHNLSRNNIRKKRKKEMKKEQEVENLQYDSNLEAVIMAHFLNRAVILDSSDKRKVTHASGNATILNYRMQFQFIGTQYR